MSYAIGAKVHARGQDWTIKSCDSENHELTLERESKTLTINYIYENERYFWVYPDADAECCFNCRFYDDGECRRHAPRPSGTITLNDVHWPDVRRMDWCGEWLKAEGI